MNVICRRACEQDREALVTLWRLSFEEDTPEDIDRFLDTFAFEQTAFVLCEDGAVCAALYVLAAAIEDAGKRLPVGYIYAGAVHPAKRGRGCYRCLLAFAYETAKADGLAALMLRPASAALAQSYRRMGFTVPLVCDEPTAANDALKGASSVCADVYIARRRECFRDSGQAFVDWDERTVAYALSWCDAVLTADGCALIAREDGTVWERVPSVEAEHETPSLLRPIHDVFEDMGPIRFGYGLE